MRHLAYTLFVLIFFQSCLQDKRDNQAASTFLKNCSQVDMVYYNHNDTLEYQTTDSLEISTLTEVISKKENIIGDTCKASGRLVYRRNGTVVFIAEFSTSNTNEEVDCTYITYMIDGKTFKHKLTYNAGMFIDDILWHKLKWSSLSNHGPIRLHEDTAKVEYKELTNRVDNLLSDSIK